VAVDLALALELVLVLVRAVHRLEAQQTRVMRMMPLQTKVKLA
jgi:hypothetical protein